MNQVKEIKIGFYIGIGIYALVVELVGIFFSEDILAYTLGLAFGVFIAVFLFGHMAKTLDYALDLQEKDATKYVRFQSFLRLMIMLAALTIGLATEQLHFITVVLGVLGLKIGALFAPFILRRLYPDSYITKEEDMVEE
ncbi:MAG: hypothetical protein E7264_08100 [Lachnospiraceae bacterium]|nr:hypothetical protein [Lachnospiraceae bacterium]